MSTQREQEDFWTGKFGAEYTARNTGAGLVASNTALFAQIFRRLDPVNSVIEFGANVGLNLHAIRHLRPDVAFAAVEINAVAAAKLREIPGVDVHVGSFLEYAPKRTYDVALIKGVLIHTNPDQLAKAYSVLYKASARYVCIVEYYNPTPVSVVYRGNENRLFKRDFAGEMLDLYSDLRLVDYGFQYHRDGNAPQDDGTWFVLEKKR